LLAVSISQQTQFQKADFTQWIPEAERVERRISTRLKLQKADVIAVSVLPKRFEMGAKYPPRP
jgi:hypothetical protein